MNPADPAFEPHPLWMFAVAHYAKPGVAGTCLELQDGYGFDINIALACLWHERRGGAALPGSVLDMMVRSSSQARERVEHIRELRRALRSDAHAQTLYQALKHAELVAENLLQRQLVDVLEPIASPEHPPRSGRTSLERYASQQDAQAPSRLLDALLLTSADGS